MLASHRVRLTEYPSRESRLPLHPSINSPKWTLMLKALIRILAVDDSLTWPEPWRWRCTWSKPPASLPPSPDTGTSASLQTCWLSGPGETSSVPASSVDTHTHSSFASVITTTEKTQATEWSGDATDYEVQTQSWRKSLVVSQWWYPPREAACWRWWECWPSHRQKADPHQKAGVALHWHCSPLGRSAPASLVVLWTPPPGTAVSGPFFKTHLYQQHCETRSWHTHTQQIPNISFDKKITNLLAKQLP